MLSLSNERAKGRKRWQLCKQERAFSSTALVENKANYGSLRHCGFPPFHPLPRLSSASSLRIMRLVLRANNCFPKQDYIVAKLRLL